MAGIRILEAFGEPIADGGQEAFVFGTMEKMNMEGLRIDCLTAYDCTSEKYRSLVERLGGSVYTLNLPFAPGKSRGNIRRPFREFLKDHYYDAVHIHSGSISVLAIMAEEAGKAGVKKVIVHSHVDGENDNLKHKILRFLTSIPMARYTTTYCACSQKAADWKFESRYAKEAHIIKNGIDTVRFSYNPAKRTEMRKQFGLEDCFVIGHVGRFTYQKNQEFLIDVLEELRKTDPSAHLMLVGAGENFEKIQETVRIRGLDQNVTLTGSVTNVQDYLQAMDVFVLPSRFEGLGIVAIEAQCCGLPVIASDVVPRDIIIKNCEFVSLSESADKWIQSIRKFRNAEREDNSAIVREHGFDARSTAEFVAGMYKG